MHDTFLIATIFGARLWHLVPLLIAVSLVYGATRHERMNWMLYHAYRSAFWLVIFLFIVWAVVFIAGWGVVG